MNYVGLAKQILRDREERLRAEKAEPELVTIRRPLNGNATVIAEPTPATPPLEPIPADPTQEQIDSAGVVLAKAGIRLLCIDGADYVGIWSDLDGPEVRAALRTYGNSHPPVRYLNADVPMRYKLRRVPGEPVPANVLAPMERDPHEPWAVRDRMLKERGWSPNGVSWVEWKAATLNKLFLEQGVLGQPGKVLPETVRHGERKGKLK